MTSGALGWVLGRLKSHLTRACWVAFFWALDICAEPCFLSIHLDGVELATDGSGPLEF
jgi:hypothetical protein